MKQLMTDHWPLEMYAVRDGEDNLWELFQTQKEAEKFLEDKAADDFDHGTEACYIVRIGFLSIWQECVVEPKEDWRPKPDTTLQFDGVEQLNVNVELR